MFENHKMTNKQCMNYIMPYALVKELIKLEKVESISLLDANTGSSHKKLNKLVFTIFLTSQ